MDEYFNSPEFYWTVYIIGSYFIVWVIAWIVGFFNRNSSSDLTVTALNGYKAGIILHIIIVCGFIFYLFFDFTDYIKAMYYSIPLLIILLVDIIFVLYLRKQIRFIDER